MSNKKGNWSHVGIGLLVGFFIVLILFFWVMGTYNGLVSKDENTRQLWGNVQTAYQRRADLIPNLVETVKGAKNFEQQTQTQIAQLRTQAGQVQQSVQNARTPSDLTNAGTEMSSILSRLMVVVEAYPDLKSNQNFLSLQDELAGTENRIKWERDQYNAGVKSYATSVRSFPGNIIASIFRFDYNKWQTFQGDATSQVAPTVDFSN